MRKVLLLVPIIIYSLLLPMQIASAASPFDTREQVINDMLTSTVNAGGPNTPRRQRYAATTTSVEREFTLAEKKTVPAERTTKRSGFFLSGGYNFYHMDYKEYSLYERSGGARRVIDQDYGNLHGLYISFGLKSDFYIDTLKGKPFVEAYYQDYRTSSATYDGGYSNGITDRPLVTGDNRERIRFYGLKLGAENYVTEKIETFYYFDIGRRTWDRGQNRIIKAGSDLVADYHEKYWWTYFGVGGGFNYDLTQKLRVGVNAEFMLAPDRFTWMYADNNELTYDLGTVWGTEIELPVKYQLSRHISLDVTPYFNYWKIEKSDLVFVGNDGMYDWYTYEPDSKLYATGVRAGLTCIF